MRMSKAALIILVATALTGCVAVWGSAYKVEAADENSVTIKYDGHFTSSTNVHNVAEANCQKFGKSPVKQDESKTIWGLTSVVFVCR